MCVPSSILRQYQTGQITLLVSRMSHKITTYMTTTAIILPWAASLEGSPLPSGFKVISMATDAMVTKYDLSPKAILNMALAFYCTQNSMSLIIQVVSINPHMHTSIA